MTPDGPLSGRWYIRKNPKHPEADKTIGEIDLERKQIGVLTALYGRLFHSFRTLMQFMVLDEVRLGFLSYGESLENTPYQEVRELLQAMKQNQYRKSVIRFGPFVVLANGDVRMYHHFGDSRRHTEAPEIISGSFMLIEPDEKLLGRELETTDFKYFGMICVEPGFSQANWDRLHEGDNLFRMPDERQYIFKKNLVSMMVASSGTSGKHFIQEGGLEGPYNFSKRILFTEICPVEGQKIYEPITGRVAVIRTTEPPKTWIQMKQILAQRIVDVGITGYDSL